MSNGAATRNYLRVAERQPVLAILSTDWRRRPPVVKRYPRQAAVALPAYPADVAGPLSLDLLSRLLADSYGLIRYRWDTVGSLPGQKGGGTLASGRPRRAVASAGALYPSELYVVTGDGWGGGRPAAVLHYDPAAHALDPVRAGDWRAVVIGPPPALGVVITSVFARTAFKYQEFGFRLQCLDAGVLTGQVLTGLEDAGLGGRVRLRFDDAAVAEALGVDPDREAPLVTIAVDPDDGPPPDGPPPDGRPAPVVGAPVGQPSPRTRPGAVLDSVPLTRDLHRSARTVADPAWPTPPSGVDLPLPAPIARLALPERAAPVLKRGVVHRRSLDGRFGAVPLALADLADVLGAAFRWSAGSTAGLDHVVPLCAVHRVDGLAAGLYRYEPASHELLRLRSGDLRAAMAPEPASARFLGDHGSGAVLVPLGDYERGLAAAGDRWFQMQNVAAGVATQRATLAGAALGLDCRVTCAFDVDRLAGALGLGDGPLRPLVQVLIGSRGTDVGYDQRL